MKDLTKNSISSHICTLAVPLAVTMLTQIAYQLVNLYFISKTGATATAGMNAGANVMLVVAAFAQVLTMGTTPLIAQAIGRKDQAAANLTFNQSIALAAVMAPLTIAAICVLLRPYMEAVAADAATARAGIEFIHWMLPSIAFTFLMAGLAAASRGGGTVRPLMTILMFTVVINVILAPVLIAGWGTGRALGLMGAGLATNISAFVGLVLLAAYFCSRKRYLRLQVQMMRPRLAEWARILSTGVPSSVEFVVTFLSTAVVYYTIRHFGPEAQAGFGIGARVLQVLLLPGLAIAFAAVSIAAQNFGASSSARVRETFYSAALIGTGAMLMITVVVQVWAEAITGLFDADAAVISVAAAFVRFMSWSFVVQSLVYVCASMFLAFGNTLPSLVGSCARFAVFSLPAVWLSTRPGFGLEQVWYLLLISIVFQGGVSLLLLRAEFRKRLSRTGGKSSVAANVERQDSDVQRISDSVEA